MKMIVSNFSLYEVLNFVSYSIIHRWRPGAEFGGRKQFSPTKFLNDLFRKKFPFSRRKFLMIFFWVIDLFSVFSLSLLSDTISYNMYITQWRRQPAVRGRAKSGH